MSTRKCVVVFSGESELDQQLSAELDSSQYLVMVCKSSEELHQLSKSSRIDAVIVCHQLPGFLTGLDIIGRLAKDLVQPISVLIGNLTADERVFAQSLQVSSVLPATTPAETIVMSVVNLLLSAIHTGIRIPYPARELVRDADCIRPIPQLIVRLAAFLEAPNASIHSLAEEISADPRVTADLLRLINSTSMGISTKQTRIEDVIRMLGVKRTISIVMSSYLLNSSQKAGFSLPENLDRQLRLRAVIEATSAKTYAVMKGHHSPDTAYVLGLLQDLGIAVLAHQLGDSYQRSLLRCRSVPQLTLNLYETQQLGFTHADVSAALLQKWELPPGLIRLVLEHHADQERRQIPATDRELLSAMKIGEALADIKENPAPQRYLAFRKLASRLAGFDDINLRSYMSQSVALACEVSELFSVPVPHPAELQRLAEGVAADVGMEFVHSADAHPADLGDELLSTDAVMPKDSDRPLVVAIDDDPQVLGVINCLLKKSGVDVRSGTTLAEVQEFLDQACVVLLDVHLGTTFGPELLESLRQSGLTAPVIMLSGDRHRSALAASIAAGATDYLPKPFTKEGLLAKIRQYAGLELSACAN